MKPIRFIIVSTPTLPFGHCVAIIEIAATEMGEMVGWKKS